MTGNIAPAAETGAVKTVAKQFFKNAEQLPGWAFLSVGYYVLFSAAPHDSTYLGVSLERHLEVIVASLTFISYQFGDALDKPIFRHFEDSFLDDRLGFVKPHRNNARTDLGVEDVYRVSLEVFK